MVTFGGKPIGPRRKVPLFPKESRVVVYACKCGAEVRADLAFINAAAPPTCPSCLTATWLVRPDPSDPVVAIEATTDAEAALSLLRAESCRAEKVAREVIKERNEPRPEEN